MRPAPATSPALAPAPDPEPWPFQAADLIGPSISAIIDIAFTPSGGLRIGGRVMPIKGAE
jgi:hypothetical protein